MRSLFAWSWVLALVVSCSGPRTGDCRSNCPQTLDVASLCRKDNRCTIDGSVYRGYWDGVARFILSPQKRLQVPLAVVRAVGARDAISIAYPSDDPMDPRLHVEIDGVEVAVEPFETVSSYSDPTWFPRFVRVPAAATQLVVWYDGSALRELRLYAFDLACIASKPPCAL